MKQAVILAGGKGTRLSERLNGKPKPLVDVAGRPLLDRQLEMLSQHGFEDVILLVNHAADQIRNFCKSLPIKTNIKIVDDGKPRGTAGAVLATLDDLSDRFLVAYGDTLFDIDFDRFWNAHLSSNSDATLFLHPNDHPHDSDLVDMGYDGFIRGFYPYPHESTRYLPNLVNAALYVIEKKALEPFRELVPPIDFGKDLFPLMLKKGKRLSGYNSFEYIKDIGTPKRLDAATRHLLTGVVERARLSRKQKAVFFDRDGTLNKPNGHINSPEQLELYEDVPSAVRRLNEAEFRVVLATNQPVLARGEANFDDLANIHAKLESQLGQMGAFLDRIEICPHHPHKGFEGEVASLKIECGCRKPGIGMIENAVKALNIDLSASWMVGDTTADMLAAQRAGLKSILVETGQAGRDGVYTASRSVTVADAPAAVSFILDIFPHLEERLAELVSAINPGEAILIEGRSPHYRRAVLKTIEWCLSSRGIVVVDTETEDVPFGAVKLGEGASVENMLSHGNVSKIIRLDHIDLEAANKAIYDGRLSSCIVDVMIEHEIIRAS